MDDSLRKELGSNAQGEAPFGVATGLHRVKVFAISQARSKLKKGGERAALQDSQIKLQVIGQPCRAESGSAASTTMLNRALFQSFQ